MRLIPAFTKFVELFQIYNRLIAIHESQRASAQVHVLEHLIAIIEKLDELLIRIVNQLELKTVRSPRVGQIDEEGTTVWNDYYPVVRSDKIARLKKLVESEWFSSFMSVEIDRQPLKDLKISLAIYLETIVRKSGHVWDSPSKHRELILEAIKNVFSMSSPLSLMMQGVLIADIADELFGFGPFGLFLRDFTIDRIIEMRDDGSFCTVGRSAAVPETVPELLLVGLGTLSIGNPVFLDVQFDNEEHKHEILGRLRLNPQTAKDGYIEYLTAPCVGFRLPATYELRKSRQAVLFSGVQ